MIVFAAAFAAATVLAAANPSRPAPAHSAAADAPSRPTEGRFELPSSSPIGPSASTVLSGLPYALGSFVQLKDLKKNELNGTVGIFLGTYQVTGSGDRLYHVQFLPEDPYEISKEAFERYTSDKLSVIRQFKTAMAPFSPANLEPVSWNMKNPGMNAEFFFSMSTTVKLAIARMIGNDFEPTNSVHLAQFRLISAWIFQKFGPFGIISMLKDPSSPRYKQFMVTFKPVLCTVGQVNIVASIDDDEDGSSTKK